MKNVAVLTEDGGIFCPLFRAHPGGFDSSRVPTPGICHPRQEKLMPGGSPKGGGGGVLGAAGIDGCITIGTYTIKSVFLPAMILYFIDMRVE